MMSWYFCKNQVKSIFRALLLVSGGNSSSPHSSLYHFKKTHRPKENPILSHKDKPNMQGWNDRFEVKSKALQDFSILFFLYFFCDFYLIFMICDFSAISDDFCDSPGVFCHFCDLLLLFMISSQSMRDFRQAICPLGTSTTTHTFHG